MDSVKIPISGHKGAGLFFTVSREDLDRVLDSGPWVLATGYVSGRANGKSTSLHRFLLNAEKGMEIDHVDGDVFNNTRSNLRQVTPNENKFNRRTYRENGVKWSIVNEKYYISARKRGSSACEMIGFARTQKEAASLRSEFIDGKHVPKWKGKYRAPGQRRKRYQCHRNFYNLIIGLL